MKNKVNRMTLIKRELRKMKRKVDKWYEGETNGELMGKYAAISGVLDNLLFVIDYIYPVKKK